MTKGSRVGMKNVPTLCVTILLLLLGCFNAKALELNSLKTFPADNPLAFQSVRAIVQDHQGFMWFGSQGALQRYDGHTFLTFHHDSSDPNSISAGFISALLIDSRQRIWVATRGGGLNLYREDTQDFQHITSKTPNLGLIDDTINALLEDSHGNIWVGSESGLNILFRQNTKEQQWSIKAVVPKLDNPKSLPHKSVQALLQTSDGQIWVGTNGGGVAVFDPKGHFVRQVSLSKTAKGEPVTRLINDLYQDRSGNVWIGTVDAGLVKHSADSNDFTHYRFDEKDNSTISSNKIESVFQDSVGRLWVASDNGLSIYQPQQHNFQRFNHSDANPYSLTNDLVLTVFEDNRQMIWIGTFSGVNRWDPKMATFSQYSSLYYPQLSDNSITHFSQSDRKYLLFSTYSGGIYRLSLDDNTMTPMPFNPDFKDLRVMTLFAEKDNIWVGTRSAGLYQVALAADGLTAKKITHYGHDAKDNRSLSAPSVTNIMRDRQGYLWVSTYHMGINRLNDDGTFSRFTQTTPISNKGPSTNHILQILEDHQGYLWLATYDGGINRFDSKTGQFLHLSHDDKIPDSLSSDLAWLLFQDSQNNLWVGTQAGGLNQLSVEQLEKSAEQLAKANFSFTHLDVKDGMKSRTVYGISEDGSGNIWFSSNKGISRFSPKQRNFKHFDTSHGLVDLEYNYGALTTTLDKSLFFGSAKGFTGVHPDDILDSPPPPQVRLTNILKLNEPMVFDHALSKLDSLTLDYSDQLISFDYVGLNYGDPETTRYRYRLLGFDQQWIDAGKLRRATYTNLPAGSYQLQVIAGNNDNIWSDPGLSLAITVNPAPWNTWWAYLLYTIFTALLLLMYSKVVNRKLLAEQQQKVLLTQQVAEKTQEFQLKNIELEQANKQLENAATTDKLTGVKSRRYLDIYIEQASQLMAQIHQNILPVQRSILPRLYLFMVRINQVEQVSNSQLINLTELLLYSRNPDDLVIRWSNDTFAIIGYEKDKNARELANRLMNRFEPIFGAAVEVDMAYSFYPFNFEQPMALSWDQVSVITEFGLKTVNHNPQLQWLGLYAPRVQPFNYLDALKLKDIGELNQLINTKQG